MAAVVSFCTIFGGSLLIGAFYGVASALCFKKLDMRHHGELIFMQSALSFAFPWAAYFTSEALELSGIVTILFYCTSNVNRDCKERRERFEPTVSRNTKNTKKMILTSSVFIVACLLSLDLVSSSPVRRQDTDQVTSLPGWNQDLP